MHLFPKYTGQYFSNYSISTKYGSEDLSIWRAISDSATRQLRKYKPQRDGYSYYFHFVTYSRITLRKCPLIGRRRSGDQCAACPTGRGESEIRIAATSSSPAT